MKRNPRKVKTLPGQVVTPAVVLSNLAEQAEEIDELVAVLHWKDGSVSIAAPDTDVATLCVLHKFLGVEIDRIMRGENA